MEIPDSARKCVAFLGYRTVDGQYHFAGTCFFFSPDEKRIFYFTARHVIDAIRGKGLDEVHIRFNLVDGTSRWQPSHLEQWKTHPSQNVDVAILLAGIEANHDHLAISGVLGANKDVFAEEEVGAGDEVFMTGLFRHHVGENRNIPIIRVGNLAAMNEEPVSTRLGAMDAYLIEARSIGGLSGSPVFLKLGPVRRLGGKVKFAEGTTIRFIGMIHGHYDENWNNDEGNQRRDDLSVERVNTGIAIVIPKHTLLDAVDTLYPP